MKIKNELVVKCLIGSIVAFVVSLISVGLIKEFGRMTSFNNSLIMFFAWVYIIALILLPILVVAYFVTRRKSKKNAE